MRIIGDVHANYYSYLNVISNVECSVQLGDFGFDYSCLDTINAKKHKIIPGNHDNYDRIGDYQHHIFQNNFGVFEHYGLRFGYIRGANSVDKQYRIPHRSWWPNEEMTYKEGVACINFFRHYKPPIILSHDCPSSIIPFVVTNRYKLIGSITSNILDEIFQISPPKMWIFGHHHQTKVVKVENTVFQCLNELDYIDV